MRLSLVLVSLALAVAAGVATAQPAGDIKPDYAKAAVLYKQAETAMGAGQYADAARDYAEAYEITKDPVLFFKIGGAQEKAGHCDVALTYYKRYLAEGNPNDEYKKLTADRIAACEAPAADAPSVAQPPPDGDQPVIDSTAQLSEKPSLIGSRPSKARGAAWITLGVGIAFGTLGAVSALSAEAAEKDIADLYSLGLPYNPLAVEQEQKLIDQGERYELLSWVAFGAAGASFITATVLFVMSGDDAEQPPVAVQVRDGGASLVGAWQF